MKIMLSTFFCLNAVKDFVIISLAALYLRIRAFVFSAYCFKKKEYMYFCIGHHTQVIVTYFYIKTENFYD